MKITLVGYMGSGKSTIGKELAALLNLHFIDLDKQIEKHTGKTVSELFKEGEIKFRKLEREVLLNTLKSNSNIVLAVGGGTPVFYDNMKQLNDYSTSVYLQSNPAHLVERLVNDKSHRPLIAHLSDEALPEFIAKHLFERRNFYEQADLTVSVNSKSTEEITKEIIRLLARHQ